MIDLYRGAIISTIGFDNVFKTLENLPTQTNYPPYNIKKVGTDKYILELAVAGFSEESIDIEVADRELKIKGQLTLDDLEPEKDITFIHKGISDRAFTRNFTMADTIRVNGAYMDKGLLKIELENVIPEELKPRKITIGKTETKTLLTE